MKNSHKKKLVQLKKSFLIIVICSL